MVALNCHTDGILFQNGEVNHDYKYFGLGKENGGNWLVKPKEYTGIEAYVAQYNEDFMKGIMGLDIDDFYHSVALFAKGNYLTCKESKDKNTGEYYKTIDFTGGGVINKASSNIVTRFMLDEKNALRLMEGDGKSFAVNFINEQNKIVNLEANRNDIASTVKVGMTNEQYAEHLKKKNKAGNPMPRRVANELSLQYGLDFKVGERIKYINNGKTKSDRDVDRDGHLSCILLQDDTIDYNVEKYLEKFTNSMKNILLCYDSEVRKKIVFSKTNKNLFFDKDSQSWSCLDGNFGDNDFQLINGQPKKESDEDNLEDLLLLNRDELFFWDKIGYSVDSFLDVK
jgi:hypothetical protein